MKICRCKRVSCVKTLSTNAVSKNNRQSRCQGQNSENQGAIGFHTCHLIYFLCGAIQAPTYSNPARGSYTVRCGPATESSPVQNFPARGPRQTLPSAHLFATSIPTKNGRQRFYLLPPPAP